jgi:hypothetical protein
MSRYELFLCHTIIKSHLPGFPGICVLTYGLLDREILSHYYQISFGIKAWLHLSSYILLKFLFLFYFTKQFLIIQTLLLLEFVPYKKNHYISFFVIVQNISVASKILKTKQRNCHSKKCLFTPATKKIWTKTNNKNHVLDLDTNLTCYVIFKYQN